MQERTEINIKFTCIGGIGEIGMNMYIYETDKTAIIVDCGVKFADDCLLGIDQIVPDFTYLKKIKPKVKGVVLTHAHEDHIGAVVHLLGEYELPIIADQFTHNMLEPKFKEYQRKPEKIIVKEKIVLGCFELEFIPISHSIPSSNAILIKATDGFTALHISDYKIDSSTRTKFPIGKFLDIGEKGLTCLMADSTNANVKGFTKGEKHLSEGLADIFALAKSRIFFTTFASNIERIQMLFDTAKRFGRFVAIEGVSLTRNITLARRMGLLCIDNDAIIPRKSIERLDDDKVCVIATGSQGELTSVISRITKDDYGNIFIREGDTFLFSTRVIPGNEKKLINIINEITSKGGKCITVNEADIHVSGHASIEDCKLLFKLTRPEYLIPVHGESLHLHAHRDAMAADGLIDEENVIISKAGRSLKFSDGVYVGFTDFEVNLKYFDQKGSFLLSESEYKERLRISTEGAVFITIIIDKEKGLIAHKPLIASAGFDILREDKLKLADIFKNLDENEIFERKLLRAWHEKTLSLAKKYFKRILNRRPILIINIEEI